MTEREWAEDGPLDKKMERPGFWKLLNIWLLIGIQSFGGGSSTTFLIRQIFITRQNWITEEDYARMWALCQFTPGMSVVALTILIGQEVGGVAGIMASVGGLLLPSATITALLAAGYSAIQNWSPVQAMLKGVIPATAGISLVVALQFARPLLTRAEKEGRVSFAFSFGLIVMAAVLVGLLKITVVFVLILAATLAAFAFSRIMARQQAAALNQPGSGEAQK